MIIANLSDALVVVGEQAARIAALEAELERVRGERDAKDHECHRLRDVLCDRNEDLTAAEARVVIAERERDAARAAAGAWANVGRPVYEWATNPTAVKWEGAWDQEMGRLLKEAQDD